MSGYNKFKALYEKAVRLEQIPVKKGIVLLNDISLHNFQFNEWLKTSKLWDGVDIDAWDKLVNDKNFAKYLQELKEKAAIKKDEFEFEKLAWEDYTDESDFEPYISQPIDWNPILNKHYPQMTYEQKQELTSIFWSAYSLCKQYCDKYYRDYEKIPYKKLRLLALDFRKAIPFDIRLDGVYYFDHLMDKLIQDYMFDENDRRFDVSAFIEGAAQDRLEFKNAKNHINNNKYYEVMIDGFAYKFYTPQLFIQLRSFDIPAINMDSGKQHIISGKPYMKTFMKAYHEGIDYFKKNYEVSPNVMYGEGAEAIVKDLEYKYNKEVIDARIGWKFVKYNYPTILTHRTIQPYGFFSGLVDKADKMSDKYHAIFRKFLSINPEEYAQPMENEPRGIEINEENNFLISSIKEHFDEYFDKGAFANQKDYEMFIDIIVAFFEGRALVGIKPIFVKNGYKKRFAYALGELYRYRINTPLTFEYLDHFIRTVSLFKDEEIDINEIGKSNLYKYFTSKP